MLFDGAIDCDIHPAVPSMQVLLPYLDDHWREVAITRGIDKTNFDMTCYPPGAPISCRPDWRPKAGGPGTDFEMLRRQALDGFGTRFAICNCLHGVQALYNEDMAAAICRAINDWMANDWMAKEPRLRSSILVPAQNPQMAVEEIERRAGDRRFVQVLMLAMGDMPLGKRFYWPIYEAAERHGLPIGIHAGSNYRHAPTNIGWPSYYLEDYVAFSAGFEGALLSLITEGVFSKFPKLKVVLIESGVTWLPAFFWRVDKTWLGVRAETPWVSRPPSEYVREHVRMTLQPVDAPPTAEQLEIVIEQIGSDAMLLFSTDYPHYQYDGQDVMPRGLNRDLAQRIMRDNPLATYTRLAAA